jgi:hypothetical protein
MERKSLHFPTLQIVVIAVCFLLGVADMTLLRDSMNSLMHMDYMTASMLALILATVANFTALLWGLASGAKMEKKSVNQHSFITFLLWALIGVAYMAIRVAAICQKIDDSVFDPTVVYEMMNMVGDFIQMLILAILYVGTGVTIAENARVIFDGEVGAYRMAKRKFEAMHKDAAEASADLQESIGKLKNYEKNYSSLEDQYARLKKSIVRAEKASMADVVGKTITSNPEIDPTAASAVMEGILERRR